MRLTKKFLAASAIAVTLLSSTVSDLGRASPFSHTIVYADEKSDKVVRDSTTAMTKLQSGQSLTEDEKSALKSVVTNPGSYITMSSTAEYVSLLKSVIQNKPNEMAEAIGVDPASAYTKVQSSISWWERNSQNSNTSPGNSLSNDSVGTKTIDHLQSDEKYPTLYASIVYSLSKGESADSTSISLAQLMRYPVKSTGDDEVSNEQYGSLASPGFGAQATPEGKKLASYIETLHKYNYLVTKDKTGFSGFWDWVTGGTTAAIRLFLLQTAWVGAALYDFSMWAINWFVDSFTKFNLIEITGLGSAIRGTDSWLNSMLKGMFSTMGLNSSVIKVIQYLFYIFIIASFLIMLITQLRKSQSKKAVTTLQRNGLKIFTIIMTIPLTAMMYSTTGAVFDAVKLSVSDVQQITSNYVVNVTEWAGTMNLSLSPISTKTMISTGEADPTFEPTTANVGKINAAISSLKNISSSGDQTAGASAREQVQDLITDKEATVQDYFNFIASRKSSGSGLAAEYFPTVSSTSSASLATRTYLLVSRDKEDDVSSIVKKLFGITDNGSEPADSVASSYSYNVAGLKKVSIGLESKYDLTPVIWNNPVSYLYGAIPPGNLTSSTLNHSNYHLSAYTDMLNDPETGETASDEALSNALVQNAVNLALINKYAGVSYSGGMKSLSSQSVAFLLQSKLSNGTLVYKGYNTAANSSGASKNTGAYGITYVENVVPSKDIVDYMSKIAGINAVWLSSGITAFIVFLTLLKAPILGSVMHHLKGFASALFTGNVISLIESMLYYIALASSFLFAFISTSVCLYFVSSLLNNTFLSYLTFIPSAGPIILSWLIVFILTWPVVNLRLGVSNKRRKVGIAALLVSVPFILVESTDEYFDRFNHAMYGKSKRQSFSSKMARQAELIDQGDQAKRTAKKGVDIAVGAGRMMAGDMTGAVQLAKGLSDDPNDPNALNKSQGSGLLGAAAGAAAGIALGAGADEIAKDLDVQGADDISKDKTMRSLGNSEDLDNLEDLSTERSSALRTSEIDDRGKEDVEVKVDKDEAEIEVSKEDQRTLKEIADNTAKLLDKESETSATETSEEKDENETSQQIEGEIVERSTPETVQLSTSKSDVSDGIMEQFRNIGVGANSAASLAKSGAEAVTDSKLGRDVSDAIEAAMTGRSIEEIRLEKSAERHEKDVAKVEKETLVEKVNTSKERVVERYEKNVQNNQTALKETPFNSDAVAKSLAGIQTLVQSAQANKTVNNVTKVVQQAAKPLAFGADNVLFDGEKVIGNALNGIKPSETSRRPQGASDSTARIIEDGNDRRDRNSERMIDAIDELTDELRRKRYE